MRFLTSTCIILLSSLAALPFLVDSLPVNNPAALAELKARDHAYPLASIFSRDDAEFPGEINFARDDPNSSVDLAAREPFGIGLVKIVARLFSHIKIHPHAHHAHHAAHEAAHAATGSN